MSISRVLPIFLSASCLVGCATYQSQVSTARDLLGQGQSTAALSHFETLAKQEGKDQLVYLLDYATALQVAGQYKESSRYFIQADQLAELKDYTSVSQQVGSLLFAEEVVQYRGEDFEKLLINTMSAINYALIGDIESAMVETRRLTEKLNYYRMEQKREYDDNAFVRYLNAHMWEASRNYDSAYIDFRKAFEMGVQPELVKQDLWRVALKGRKSTELAKLKAELGVEPKLDWQKKGYGELVIIHQVGWGPRKSPNPESPRFPILVPEQSRTSTAAVEVEGQIPVTTQQVYDLTAASITTLQSQYGELIAKRLAGFVAKEAVAKQVSEENEALGALLFVAMHASDRADLRQWSTLPDRIQMTRIDLPQGQHTLRFKGLDSAGTPTGEESDPITVKIKPGRKTFVGWRSFK